MQYRLLLTGLVILTVSFAACVPYEEVRPAKERATYHYMLGVAALDEKNPTDALKEFLLAEEADDRDPKIQSVLAQAYWLKQAHGLAEEHFQAAIELSDGEPEYYQNIAALYLTMERYDDAISSFRTAAENLLFDRPELSWTGIGFANFQKQDYAAAERSYKKSIAINPRYYMAPFRLGELYYSQGRPVEALDMFTRTVELAPRFPDGHYWQGLVYMKIKDAEKAKLAFREVVRLAPQSETARLANNYLKIINK